MQRPREEVEGATYSGSCGALTLLEVRNKNMGDAKKRTQRNHWTIGNNLFKGLRGSSVYSDLLMLKQGHCVLVLAAQGWPLSLRLKCLH